MADSTYRKIRKLAESVTSADELFVVRGGQAWRTASKNTEADFDFDHQARLDVPILLNDVEAQAAEISTLQKRVEELEQERDKADSARKHTQEWYSRHYGKLQDWARKRLPEEWADEFFNCVANGTWGHKDRGKPYTCNAGFVIEPSNYFRVDTAEGQLILDQTKRAEDAESSNADLTRQLEEERARLTVLAEFFARNEEYLWEAANYLCPIELKDGDDKREWLCKTVDFILAAHNAAKEPEPDLPE